MLIISATVNGMRWAQIYWSAEQDISNGILGNGIETHTGYVSVCSTSK